MDENIYHIPEENRWRMDQLFAKLEKRANKLGLPVPGYTVLAENLVEKTDDDKNKYYVKVLDVEVFGTTPKFAGWSFLAVLINEGVGNVINPLPGNEIGIPAFYRTSGTICQHCNQSRSRKQTFLLHNQDTQEFKQVGSSCIVDFLGNMTPEGIASYAEFLSASLDEISNCEESDVYPGSRSATYYSPIDYLAVAVAVIEERGYTSRAKSDYSIGKPATADLVATEFLAYREYKTYTITQDHIEKAKMIWAWAREFFSLEANRESDFGWSFYVITQKDYLTYKDFGRITYLPTAYAVEIEKMIKREKQLTESAGFVGNIGDKVTFTGTVLVSKLINQQYHFSTYLLKFQDEAGHIFTWFASDDNNLVAGDVAEVKGKIKDHSEFRGEQSTVVTRCKVNKVEEEKEQ